MDLGAHQFEDEKNLLWLSGIKAQFLGCLLRILTDVSRLPMCWENFGENMQLSLGPNFCGTYHKNIGATQKFNFAFGTISMTNEELELSK